MPGSAAAAARFFAGRVGRDETVLFERGNRGVDFLPMDTGGTASGAPMAPGSASTNCRPTVSARSAQTSWSSILASRPSASRRRMSKRQPALSAGRSEKPPSMPSGRLRRLRPQSLAEPRGDRTAYSSMAGKPVRL